MIKCATIILKLAYVSNVLLTVIVASGEILSTLSTIIYGRIEPIWNRVISDRKTARSLGVVEKQRFCDCFAVVVFGW